MSTLTEGRHTGEFLVSEANGTRSRETVTIVSGQNLAAGAVVGKITASGKYAVYNNALDTGVEVAAGILYAAVDASDGDVEGVIIARDAEVHASELDWGASDGTAITAGTADLLALNIHLRAGY